MESTRTRTKSGETRARILASARRAFALGGFEGATIRAVASEAAVDPAMVIRYFRNKEGLFAEAVSFDLGIPDLTGVPPEQVGTALAEHVLRVWEGPEGREMLPALLRTACSTPAAAEKMQQIFRKQIRPAVAAVTGPEHAAEAAALVVTQILGLAYTRYVLKLAPVVALSKRVLVAELGATLQRYLCGPRS